MHKLGVEIIPYARLFGADGDTVYFLHSSSNEAVICEGVDTLVVSQGHLSETALEQALDGCGSDIHLVGDCLSPRSAEEAIYEALIAARKI